MSSNADAPGVSTAASPRASATVLLLREASDGIEVLMTLRHEGLAFMGGLWVFPGGALHVSDGAPRMLDRISDRSQGRCRRFSTLTGEHLTDEQCLSLAIAACRETFEETGVLLAVNADHRPCPAETLATLQMERKTVATQSEHFAVILERERLLLDIGRLVYWSHWITPSIAPRRFDTRFFAVAVESDQTVTADSTETSECRWLSPDTVIELADREQMPISPPTRCNLIDLRDTYLRHGSLRTLLHAEAHRTVPPILPKMIHDEAHTTVVMPWDEAYASLAGESGPANLEFPASVLTQPSRLQLRRRT